MAGAGVTTVQAGVRGSRMGSVATDQQRQRGLQRLTPSWWDRRWGLRAKNGRLLASEARNQEDGVLDGSATWAPRRGARGGQKEVHALGLPANLISGIWRKCQNNSHL